MPTKKQIKKRGGANTPQQIIKDAKIVIENANALLKSNTTSSANVKQPENELANVKAPSENQSGANASAIVEAPSAIVEAPSAIVEAIVEAPSENQSGANASAIAEAPSVVSEIVEPPSATAPLVNASANVEKVPANKPPSTNKSGAPLAGGSYSKRRGRKTKSRRRKIMRLYGRKSKKYNKSTSKRRR
jgi:hypothetical protein